MSSGGIVSAVTVLAIVLVLTASAIEGSVEEISDEDLILSSNESAQKSSLEWSKDYENFERNEKFVTRCRLRPINYWNYTQGQAKVVLGHQFEFAIGVSHHYPSSPLDIFDSVSSDREVPIHRHKRRLFSIFNPFFLNPSESQTRDSNNYVLVNRKKRLEKTTLSSPRRERLIVDSQCSLVFIYARWCPFSMAAAPYVNALARAFPQLPLVAIDVDEYLRYRWSLRVFYVPKLKIFVGDNVYREFNGTDTDLDEMVDFVWLNLRILPQGPVGLRRSDFLGPVPNQLVIRPTDAKFLPLVWTVFLLSMVYFLASCFDWRRVRQHLTAAFKSVIYLLDRRRGHLFRQHYRESRRHAAAYAALPSPSPSTHRFPSSVVASTSTDPHPHAD
ncbi:hypothetical protein Aperf_G00000086847 [Anoplocephala perfoliata]